MDKTPGIRPRPSFWRRLDIASRHVFPASSTGFALLLTAAPLGLPAQAELQASIALSAVYFWTLFRPASMRPPTVFALGVLSDLLGFSPIGVTVLTLLTTHGLAMRWRRVLIRQGFALVWLAFVGVAAGAALLGWAFTSLLTFRLLPPGPAILLAALAAGLYPALATVLTLTHQTLADPERA